MLACGWLATAFAVLAAIGTLRMPDLYSRLQASSKAPALSVVLALVAVVIALDATEIAMRGIALVLLVFITSPISAHLIARAGFLTRVEVEPGTELDLP